MLLGKRPRHSMKRTTSMSQITLDLNTTTKVEKRSGGVGFNGLDQSQSKLVIPRTRKERTSSSDFEDTHDFLRTCSLCKRHLVPGRDIYMYRGDNGFCSLECRQEQINQDERKEKYFVASKKQVVATQSGSKSKVTTTKGETTLVA